MYVAVTRAKRSLTLTWCGLRERGRDALKREPSRFLAEMQLEAAPLARRPVREMPGSGFRSCERCWRGPGLADPEDGLPAAPGRASGTAAVPQ